MATEYKATLYLTPIPTGEHDFQDRVEKFPGNFPSAAEDDRDLRGAVGGQQNKDTMGDRRELVFKPGKQIHPIGRASSNVSKGFVAAKGNGYFSSPVMSRYHAIIKMQRKKLFITDAKSMHGTYLNGTQLSEEREELKSGDRLTFGTQVTREGDTYHPKDFDCTIVWERLLPKSRPVKSTQEDIGIDNTRRTSGYGVSAEDLMVSDGEIDKEAASIASQSIESEGESYGDYDDESDYEASLSISEEYGQEDEYIQEGESSPMSSVTSHSSTNAGEPTKEGSPAWPDKLKSKGASINDTSSRWSDKLQSSPTASLHTSATSESWRKILMNTCPERYAASDKKGDTEKKREKNLEVQVELVHATFEKPRRSRFSIDSLMNEPKETNETKTPLEIMISDDEEDQYENHATAKGKGKEFKSGSKAAPISLSDDDAEGEDEIHVNVEEVPRRMTETNNPVMESTEQDTESEDEPPEEADVKGDEETRNKHLASSADELHLRKEGMVSQPVDNSLPTEKPPLPPVRFSLGSPTFSYTNPNNTLNAPDVRNLVQASESLQAVLRNSDYYEPPSGDLASPHANSHARESPDNIRRREFFAAREANAAILSATHGSNDSNRGFNITTPSLGTFQPPSSMRPSASVGSHPLPWVRNYPTPGDGLSPYGLFPTVQNNHKNEHIQPHVTPSKPTLDAAPSTTGNVMKPNIYEQILSSEVARSRQADLDRIKENLKEFLLKDIATPWTDIGEDEDEMAMSDASEDNISESECVEDMEEGIEDTHTDIRTDVSEAGSNATSTERRNAALMTDLNDAPTFNSDPWRGWRPVSLRVVETTSARGFPISSLVNQNAAETPKGPVLEVKMQDRDDTSTQVFELDVATAPRGTKRKFEAEDMVEDVIEDVRQENEGADQKEVAGTMSAVNSDEDVPKEVTLDGVTNKVASLDIKEESSSNGEPSRKKQRTWPTITTSFALGAVMGGVGVFAALVASAP